MKDIFRKMKNLDQTHISPLYIVINKNTRFFEKRRYFIVCGNSTIECLTTRFIMF